MVTKTDFCELCFLISCNALYVTSAATSRTSGGPNKSIYSETKSKPANPDKFLRKLAA